jgi:uncharacterized membrane-anchored protein
VKRPVFIVFAIVALLQLAVPAKMILDKENILTLGTPYKFRTAPIDPSDPFRGKYITLDFSATSFETPNDSSWQTGDAVYVHLGKDAEGFARIKDLTRQPPADGNIDYVKARIRYVYDERVTIEYPFTRFYMEETRAPEAEMVYRSSRIDTAQVVYALVNVRNGEAALQDVKVNDVSISEVVADAYEK